MAPASDPGGPPAGPRGPKRNVVDRRGASWLFYEYDAPHARTPRRSLVADSGDVLRRFDRYPADWQSCDAEQLLALVHGPARRPRVVPGRFTPAPLPGANDEGHGP